MTAADVGCAAAPLQLGHHPIERRQPSANEVGVIACAKETLGAVEQARVMLTPFHTLTRAEVAQSAIANMIEILDDEIRTRQIDGTCRVREAGCLFRG